MNIIDGSIGNDRLTGTSSADWLRGQVGSDTLNGGLGNDILIGGLGADTLIGGGGADIFDLESSIAELNGDRILDLGYTDIVALGETPLGAIKMVQDGADIRVTIDQNGDGVADQTFWIAGLSVESVIAFNTGPTYIALERGIDENFEGVASLSSMFVPAGQWTDITIIDPTINTNAEQRALKSDILAGGSGWASSRIDISSEQVHDGSTAIKFVAAGATSATPTTKASLDTHLAQYGDGDVFFFSGMFKVQSGTPLGILDLESSHDAESPGLRLLLDEAGHMRVEFKAGSKPTVYASDDVRLSVGDWARVSVRYDLSTGADGNFQVWLDNRLVIESTGVNLPHAGAVYDRVQVGVTANSSVNAAVVFADGLKSGHLEHETDGEMTLADGTRLVWGTAGNDVYRGAAGSDNLFAGDGNDSLYGGSGNDTLTAGGGIDSLAGEAGDDTYEINLTDDLGRTPVGHAIVVEERGQGVDTVRLLDKAVPSDLRLWIDDGGDLRLGFAGAVGSVSVQGEFRVDAGGRIIGSDVFERIERVQFSNGEIRTFTPHLDASDSDDSHAVHGTQYGDILRGAGGDDQIYGWDGADTLVGGTGNDVIRGGYGNDLLNGEAGTDVVYGDDGDDTFAYLGAADQQDQWIGGAGADIVKNMSGTSMVFSTFPAGWSVETIDGGSKPILGTAGNDMIDFRSVSLINIGHIDAGAGNDTVYGTNGVDTIGGGTGDDWLYGSGGDDLLAGFDGVDRLFGDAGNDTFAFVTNADAGDFVDGGSGTDVVKNFSGSNMVLTGDLARWQVEAIDAVGKAIVGTSGSETMNFSRFTLLNVEKIDGGTGNDVITGTAGADKISGDVGNDTIVGGAGDDIILGGAGTDLLIGGAGKDTFIYVGGSEADIVQDFEGGAGAGDRLDFSRLGSAFNTYGEVMAVASQSGANLVFNFAAGHSLTLLNRTTAAIASDDFFFGV